MTATWFRSQFPPSRSAIENELRLAIWKAGLGNMWLSCTSEQVPYACVGYWQGTSFEMEWEPAKFLMLKSAQANEALLATFEKLIGHKALAAYRDGDGRVVVEWRAKEGDARFQELQESGVRDLERLNR